MLLLIYPPFPFRSWLSKFSNCYLLLSPGNSFPV
jgi:hypothetical protein